MKTALVFLITGFEEIEVVATVDVLRRGGVEVKTVSLTAEKIVLGSHHLPIIADLLFADVDFSLVDMLILPGGTPNYNQHIGVKDAFLAFYQAGKEVAAICASPMVLGGLGILKGRRATCYPGFEQYLEGAVLTTDQDVVVDGHVITGRGPGVTIPFALQLLEMLTDKVTRDNVAKGLLVGN